MYTLITYIQEVRYRYLQCRMKTDSQFAQSKKQVKKKTVLLTVAISKQSKAAYLKLNSESEI